MTSWSVCGCFNQARRRLGLPGGFGGAGSDAFLRVALKVFKRGGVEPIEPLVQTARKESSGHAQEKAKSLKVSTATARRLSMFRTVATTFVRKSLLNRFCLTASFPNGNYRLEVRAMTDRVF